VFDVKAQLPPELQEHDAPPQVGGGALEPPQPSIVATKRATVRYRMAALCLSSMATSCW
jgi:hypothetical protein